jgi:hypothetical protein
MVSFLEPAVLGSCECMDKTSRPLGFRLGAATTSVQGVVSDRGLASVELRSWTGLGGARMTAGRSRSRDPRYICFARDLGSRSFQREERDWRDNATGRRRAPRSAVVKMIATSPNQHEVQGHFPTTGSLQ